jgi:hypothetical protein
MLESNRFTEFFARLPSAPPLASRKDRRPWSAADLFDGTEAIRTLGDAGRTFSECVCEYLGLHPNQYENTVFRLCLYRKALALHPLLQRYDRNFFAPDHDFIRRVGKARRREELLRELDEFYYHPKNGGWLRRRFSCRVSGRKLVALAREVMPELHSRSSVEDYFPPADKRSARLGPQSA